MTRTRSKATTAPVPFESIEKAIKLGVKAGGLKLFGTDPARYEEIYHRLIRVSHPDQYATDPAMLVRAEAATKDLQEMYAAVNGKAPAASPVRIGDWVVESAFANGDLCALYRVSPATDKVKGSALLKLARSAKDNDLMKAEAESLTSLFANREKAAVNFQRLLPRLHGSVSASGRSGNIIEFADGYIPLAEFNSLWTTLSFKHIIWMINRALSALNYVHLTGIVHGAVLPSHLLLDPATHQLKLIDWCYSVKTGSPLRAISSKYKWMYPEEVLRKSGVGPATDIYMLFRSLTAVNTAWPQPFEHIRTWCLAASPNARPQSADVLLDRWLETARAVYGPPKFVPLDLPVGN